MRQELAQASRVPAMITASQGMGDTEVIRTSTGAAGREITPHVHVEAVQALVVQGAERRKTSSRNGQQDRLQGEGSAAAQRQHGAWNIPVSNRGPRP